jgi:hypothetical protein
MFACIGEGGGLRGGNDQHSGLQRPRYFCGWWGGMLSSTQSIVVDDAFRSTSENRLATATSIR